MILRCGFWGLAKNGSLAYVCFKNSSKVTTIFGEKKYCKYMPVMSARLGVLSEGERKVVTRSGF